MKPIQDLDNGCDSCGGDLTAYSIHADCDFCNPPPKD